jgi:hypothetical protein
VLRRWSRDSSVGIVTGYGWITNVPFPEGAKNFPFSIRPRPALGPTKLPLQWIPGPVSPDVKRPQRNADHWTASSAEVKNYFHIRLHGVLLNQLSTGTTLPFSLFYLALMFWSVRLCHGQSHIISPQLWLFSFLGWGETESTWYVGY